MRCGGKPVRPGTGTPRQMSKAHSLPFRMGPGSRTPSGPAVQKRLRQQAEDKTAFDPRRNIKSILATREPSRQDISTSVTIRSCPCKALRNDRHGTEQHQDAE